MDLIMNGGPSAGSSRATPIPDLFIPRLLDLYVAGRFPYDRLIREFPFDRINDAVAAMEDGSVIKPVLRFQD